MSVEVTCPKCGTICTVPDDAVGKKGQCHNPGCQFVFEIAPAVTTTDRPKAVVPPTTSTSKSPAAGARPGHCIECGKAAYGSNYAGLDLKADQPFPDRIDELTLPGDPAKDVLCVDCANKRTVTCKAHGKIEKKFGWGKAPHCEYCELETSEVCIFRGPPTLTDRALAYSTQTKSGLTTYTHTVRIPWAALIRCEVVRKDGDFDKLLNRLFGEQTVTLRIEYVNEFGREEQQLLSVEKPNGEFAATYAEELRKGRPVVDLLNYLLQTPPPVLMWHRHADTALLAKYVLAKKASEHYRLSTGNEACNPVARSSAAPVELGPMTSPGLPLSTPVESPPPARRLVLPGISLAVLGVMNLLFAAIMLAAALFMTETTAPLKGDGPVPSGPRQKRPMTEEELAMSRLFSTILAAATGLPGLTLVLGGIQMARHRWYSLAMASSVVALLPGITVCCIAGVPVGIWSLAVLANREVKGAFSDPLAK